MICIDVALVLTAETSGGPTGAAATEIIMSSLCTQQKVVQLM